MGNNTAYTIFEHTIITLYNKGVLDLDLLDTLAKKQANSDIDRGGSCSLKANDRKNLEEICLNLIYPEWKPKSAIGSEDYWDEWMDKWDQLEKRWNW